MPILPTWHITNNTQGLATTVAVGVAGLLLAAAGNYWRHDREIHTLRRAEVTSVGKPSFGGERLFRRPLRLWLPGWRAGGLVVIYAFPELKNPYDSSITTIRLVKRKEGTTTQWLAE